MHGIQDKNLAAWIYKIKIAAWIWPIFGNQIHTRKLESVIQRDISGSTV